MVVIVFAVIMVGMIWMMIDIKVIVISVTAVANTTLIKVI